MIGAACPHCSQKTAGIHHSMHWCTSTKPLCTALKCWFKNRVWMGVEICRSIFISIGIKKNSQLCVLIMESQLDCSSPPNPSQCFHAFEWAESCLWQAIDYIRRIVWFSVLFEYSCAISHRGKRHIWDLFKDLLSFETGMRVNGETCWSLWVLCNLLCVSSCVSHALSSHALPQTHK